MIIRFNIVWLLWIDCYLYNFHITSDDQRVVYRDGAQETGGDIEKWLRTVKIDGTGRELVHPVFPNNDAGDVKHYIVFGFILLIFVQIHEYFNKVDSLVNIS